MARNTVRSMSFFDKSYRRERDLPALLGLMPWEFPEDGEIVDLLAAALEREKRAARRGKWHYDLNRHIRLMQALKAEKAGSPVEARS